MKVKTFEFKYVVGTLEQLAANSDFEREVSAFCESVDVRFVVKIREDIVGVWYENDRAFNMPAVNRMD